MISPTSSSCPAVRGAGLTGHTPRPVLAGVSWLHGFKSAIYRRLVQAEQRAQVDAETAAGATQSSGPSVALVLVDREAVVKQAVADAYPKLRKAPRRVLSGDGSGAGYRAGQRANLGGTGIGAPASRQVGTR